MGRYTAVHSSPAGPGDTRPTALQIIHDESLEGKLSEKVIVITGAASGLGLATARALAATGATLLLTARDRPPAASALDDVLHSGRASLVQMDLGSMESVRAAAASILDIANGRVNILVNNAGVLGHKDLTLTADGHEMHFGTNHLGHFLLFQLLKPAMLTSSSPDFHSRVVNIASSSHRALESVNSEGNYNFEKGGYDTLAAYNQSKLANIYMANELERRYGRRGIHATSVHPGSAFTNIGRHQSQEFVQMLMTNEALVKALKSPEQGAASTVVAAVSRDWEDRGGRYLEDCDEAPKGREDGDIFGSGYVHSTYNPSEEARLWKDSLEMVNMADDE